MKTRDELLISFVQVGKEVEATEWLKKLERKL